MSKTQYVSYDGRGFWAYDVALGILLKHMIDVAELRSQAADVAWLAEAAAQWRVVACLGGSAYGLEIDETWPVERRDIFTALVTEACGALANRESIRADEVAAWPILGGEGLHARGAQRIATGPIIELGKALVDLVNGSLPTPPEVFCWLFGLPEGRTTTRMA
jgi:hypothetical protein